MCLAVGSVDWTAERHVMVISDNPATGGLPNSSQASVTCPLSMPLHPFTSDSFCYTDTPFRLVFVCCCFFKSDVALIRDKGGWVDEERGEKIDDRCEVRKMNGTFVPPRRVIH